MLLPLLASPTKQIIYTVIFTYPALCAYTFPPEDDLLHRSKRVVVIYNFKITVFSSVGLWMGTNVLEKTCCFHLYALLFCLKMEASATSETLLCTYQTANHLAPFRL
jgi:hypothetical protein